MTVASSRTSWPWLGAGLGIAVAVCDTFLLGRLGVRFEGTEARDVTVLVGATFASSLAILGFLLGRVAELRQRERAATERLAQSERRLRESDRLASLGQLASAIAHEVRNPLAVIRSWVQNLSEELPETAPGARSTCTLLLEEVDRVSHVTQSLVAFARPLPVRRAPVPVAEVLERTQLLAARMLAEGADRLEVKSDAIGARLVSADADLLCQLLLGLVANAAQVAPEGSPIVVDARVAGAEVELAVEDRGPGVPAELRAKIFEPFFTTRPGGTGLGLAVARQIATAHDARLDVEDRPGGGARFVLRMAEVAS